MKEISEYINDYIDNKVLNEGLVSWLNAFIEKMNNAQKKLVQGGKINMLKMDVNKLQFQKEPVKLEDVSKDRYTQEIWADKKLGFPMSAEIAKNTQKYIQDIGDIKARPYVYTFYYKSTLCINTRCIICNNRTYSFYRSIYNTCYRSGFSCSN